MEFKIPDIIIQSLFVSEKVKSGIKELQNFFSENVTEENKNATLKPILLSLKNDLFIDKHQEYKNYIMRGDITPIIIVSTEILPNFDAEPDLYFILLQPVFDLFNSLEPKLIISFTNQIISKILKNEIKLLLTGMNELFEVLITLKTHQEQDVKNAGNSLDKILKEAILTYSLNPDIFYNLLNFESLCDKFLMKINSDNEIVHNLVLNYINYILDNTDLNLIKILPKFLPWLFKIQNREKNKELLMNADFCFDLIKNNILLKYVKFVAEDKETINKILLILIKEAIPKNNKLNLSLWDLLNQLSKKFESYLIRYIKFKNNNENMNNTNNCIKSPKLKSKAITSSIGISEIEDIDIKKTINNNNDYKNSKKNQIFNEKFKSSKKLILNPLHNDFNPINKWFSKENSNNSSGLLQRNSDKEFLNSYDKNITNEGELISYIPFNLFSEILVISIESQSFDVEDKTEINKLNVNLKNMIKISPDEICDYGFVIEDITNIILISIKNPLIKNKESLIDWLKLLYEKYKNKIFEDFTVFIREYIRSIPGNNHRVFLVMIELLCSFEGEQKYTELIIKNLTNKLLDDINLINNESFIILLLQNITKNNDIQKLYISFVDALLETKNYLFVSKMVNYLNDYMIREPRAAKFRKALIKSENQSTENKKLFSKIYNVWSFNPISLLIYCIITENFELSYNIILNLVKVKLEEDYYIHLGQLVQLLESEMYNYIRMKLLEPANNIYLVKSFYGILMLLPQGVAYNNLSKRMNNIEILLEIEDGFNNLENIKISDEVKKFIEIFLENQKLKKEFIDKKKN